MINTINYLKDWIKDLEAMGDEQEAISVLETAICALKSQKWISVEDRLPKSGKHVLLYCEARPGGGKYICDGYYAEENDITQGGEDGTVLEYSDEDDEYYLVEGFYEVVKNWDDFYSISIDDFVTHWQPLPVPPEKDGAE